MKRIDVLKWGLQHIAANHNLQANTEDYLDENQVCIWGGCNVPTLADVQMLCEDLKIPKDYIYTDDFGITVELPRRWKQDAEYKVTGWEMWKKSNVEIGS